MSLYPGLPLPKDGDYIRLLRLLPNEDEAAQIQCKLHNYCLQQSSARTHTYNALSYVWGNEGVTESIYLENNAFQVTVNLHAALLRLRDRSFEQIIWVDAICINQKNADEREEQVKLMAKIYSKAQRVIVWLGNEVGATHRALKDICIAANVESKESLKERINTQAIIDLLSRPWFQRIWVLQEVAAARHIVVMCGYDEIDGYAFCSGIKSLNISFTASPELQTIPAVLYLIERASFRPKYTSNSLERFSLDIRSLSELIDMFHTRKASDVRDKVYALLGMSSDFPDRAGLQPDYKISWEIVFQKLIKYIISGDVSVKAFDHNQRAVIKSKGCILGQVLSVRSDDKQHIKITLTKKNPSIHRIGCEWTLHSLAKPIRVGDIVCLLEGASKPTIIRLCMNHFDVIVIAVTPLNDDEEPELLSDSNPFPRDFALVWDLENSTQHSKDEDEHENSIEMNNQILTHSRTELARRLVKLTRIWNMALILRDLREHNKAETKRLEAIQGYNIALGNKHISIPRDGLAPLSWATANGLDIVEDLLLVTDGADLDLKDSQYGRTLLSWAARGGHETIVQKLLKLGKVSVDSQDYLGRTPLSWAAIHGHDTVVKLLLETGADVNAKDNDSNSTPLSWAAKAGHEAVVKLLLEADGIEVDPRDKFDRTPLSLAAENGNGAVVKLLLERSVNVKLEDIKYSRTPLVWAAERGHEAVVKLLLQAEKLMVEPFWWKQKTEYEATNKLLFKIPGMDVDWKSDSFNLALLWLAAYRRQGAVATLLLEIERDQEPIITDKNIALLIAVEVGVEALVKLLLQDGANANAKTNDGQTALYRAVKTGKQSIMMLLLKNGASINDKCSDGKTALYIATERGWESIVVLLVENGASIDDECSDGKTALHIAVESGWENIVVILLKNGARTDYKCFDGKTALHIAAERGWESIVVLLVENGASTKEKCSNGKSALYQALENGHYSTVKVLLEKGAIIEVTDNEGREALRVAAIQGYLDIVQLFLDKGAVLDAMLIDRKTPITVISQNRSEAIVRLLTGEGAIVKGETSDGMVGMYFAAKTNKRPRSGGLFLEHFNHN